MPKPIIQNLGKQIGKISEETIKTANEQPGEMAGRILERMGAASAQSPKGQSVNPRADAEKQKLAQLEAQDKAKKDQQIMVLKKQLEEEIEKWRRIREEQLRQRRRAAEETQKQPEEKPILEEPKGKKPRGLLAGVSARKRESQAELAGGRRSG